MNDEINRQAQQMFTTATLGRIPDNVQSMAQDTVANSRKAYEKATSLAESGAKVVEELISATQTGTRTIVDKVSENTRSNIETAFATAGALAAAKSVPELMRLQGEYVQQQVSAAADQAKELLELSAKVAKDTYDAMNTAATKSMENVRKSA